MANRKRQKVNRRPKRSEPSASGGLSRSEKLARQIEYWRDRLGPRFPDIDPHDLDLIIAELLKTPKERMAAMFLKRREDGTYVF